MRLNLALFLLAILPLFSKAAIVNRQYEITLFNDVGHYSAGHVFRLSATYDDASYGYTWWEDGPNGKAELGGGDDTLGAFLGTSPIPASDATLSLTGLLSPPATGLIPRDENTVNESRYYEFIDFYNSLRYDVFFLRADDLVLYFDIHSPSSYSLSITQHFTDEVSGQPVTYFTGLNPFENSKLQILTPVPEPSAIGLAGAAMAILVLVQHLSRRTGPVGRSRLARRSAPATGE
jgi:hypothetical protein